MFEIPTPNTIPDENIPFLPNPFTRENNRRFMNPIRRKVNYVILPVYLAVCALSLGTGVLVMSIDDTRYGWLMVLCLFIVAVASAVVLWQVPGTRKQEIRIEMSRYDFDPEHFAQMERYPVKNELWDVVLTPTGLLVNGKHHYYSALQPTLVTSNHFNRVWISVRFGSDPWHGVYVPLDGSVIRAVREFEIPLQGAEKIPYLLEHTENVFAQIYQYGDFTAY